LRASPERDAHADFAAALRDRPIQHAVDAADRERARDRRERERQDHRRALRAERARDARVHRANVEEREIWIE
jgi:hypothetical protein